MLEKLRLGLAGKASSDKSAGRSLIPPLKFFWSGFTQDYIRGSRKSENITFQATDISRNSLFDELLDQEASFEICNIVFSSNKIFDIILG